MSGTVDLNDPVIKKLVGARIRLLLDKPWFGQMACHLMLVDATKWCDTAATDGRCFYFNREFIKRLKDDELLFLMGHEVLHCVFGHIGRRADRDPDIWNMAADYLINYVLKKEDVGTVIATALIDNKYTDEMTTEEIYKLLLESSVAIKKPIDMHLDGKGSEDGDEDGNGNVDGDITVMGKNGPPKLTAADLKKIENEIRAAVIRTAQAVGAGNVPLGVRRMIEDLIEPKLDWRSLLDAHIRSCVKDDYTMQRLSRRSWSSGGFLLPAQDYQLTIDIVVAIDASGSMTQEMLRDLLSETKGIVTTFRDFRLKVFTFDHNVYNLQEFTPENVHEIDHYELKGGGGTSFEVCYEFMKREGIEPMRFVMFTDGYPNGTWGDPNYCDTLFVVHGSTTIVAPFGLTAYYDAPQKGAVGKRAA